MIIQKLCSAFSNFLRNSNVDINVQANNYTKIHSRHVLINVSIDKYSYVASNSNIRNTKIGKFCSIGPNFLCGLAIHPTDGISTSPFFYSTLKQCGVSIAEFNKIEEFKDVTIGNDVFIGANVTILGGIEIGDGAVIATGAVVTKNIPEYAIVGGVPAKIIRYRFSDEIIKKIKTIQWWDFHESKFQEIERNFFDVENFVMSQSSELQNV